MIDFAEQPGGGAGQDPAPRIKASEPAVDTSNEFEVVAGGETVRILNPPTRPITKAESLRLAAWLVVMSRASADELCRMIDKIKTL